MRTALITGAASGLGQALAERLAKDGWRLNLWDRNREGLEQTIALCGAADAAPRGVDLSNANDVEQSFEAMKAAERLPDFIFHAAGVLDTGDLDAVSVAACRRAIDVNYMGTVHLLLAARERLAQGARIICVSSIAGLKGLPEFAGYCASKFAVYGFCEALHGDFKRRGIALSVLCPPAIDTPMVRNLPSKPILYELFPFAEKELVIRSIVRAIDKRGSFLILVDAQSKLLYRVNGLMPRITSSILEGMVQRKKRQVRS